MIRDLVTTFRQTAIYGFSNILVKAAGFVLLPIYTSNLNVEGYGMLVLLEIVSQFFVGVISFQLPSALLRYGSDTSDKIKQNGIFFTASIMTLVLAVIFLVVSLPFAGESSQLFFGSKSYAVYFNWLVISIVFEMLSVIPMQYLRLQEKPTQYLFFFSIKLVSMVFFVWYFIGLKGYGVYGAVVGLSLANISMWLSTIIIQLKNFHFKFHWQVCLAMLKYGTPLIFTTIAGVLLTISDRLIIKIFGGFSEVGVYGLAYKIGSFSNLIIIGTFSLGFLPIAFKKAKDENFSRFFSKMFTYFIAAIAILTLIVSMFSNEIIKLISNDDPSYWLAILLVPFIAFVFIFKGIQNYFSYVFLITKRTGSQAMITMIGVLTNIILNFLLIPKFDIYGAVAATGLSYIIMGIISYNIAQQFLRIHYDFRRIAILLLVTSLAITTAYYFNDFHLFLRIILKCALIVSFCLYLAFGISDSIEREKVRKVFALYKKDGVKAVLAMLVKG